MHIKSFNGLVNDSSTDNCLVWEWTGYTRSLSSNCVSIIIFACFDSICWAFIAAFVRSHTVFMCVRIQLAKRPFYCHIFIYIYIYAITKLDYVCISNDDFIYASISIIITIHNDRKFVYFVIV